MKKVITLVMALLLFLTGCVEDTTSQQRVDAEQVDLQQGQYAIGQPVPQYDFSLERDLLVQLYNIRNQNVATHSVWRSDYGMIEGDCPSIGYGLPYDTSLTNPLVAFDKNYSSYGMVAIGQPEPNGIFASTNTSATWVMCANDLGQIEPHYVESKVSVYPYPVSVDYTTDVVSRSGETSVTIESARK